ncbi:MAG: Ig-like domain-containing protein [Chloroflexota bacterium]
MKRFVTGTLIALLVALLLPTGVLAAPVSLDFTPLPAVTYGDGPIDATLYTADDGSLTPITYASNSLSVCTVSGSTISIAGAGTCSITATQSSVDSTDTFPVAKADQTLGFDISGVSKTYGNGPFPLTPYATPGASSSGVTYSSDTTSVCTVAGATLTIHTAGDCTIQASQAGDANYNAATPVTSTMTIAKANQHLDFDISGANKSYGASPFSLTPFTTSGGSSAAVQYQSNTLSACTVSGATLTILTAGNCTIEASQAGDINYNVATPVTSTLNVAKANQTLLFDISGLSKTYGASPFSLTPSTTEGASTGAVSYTSNTPTVCSVSGDTLTILTAGDCIIEASQAGDGNYNAATPVTSTLHVQKANQTVDLNFTGINKTFGDGSFSLAPYTVPGAGTGAISYTSQTGSVCSVSGVNLTIMHAGTCTITATQAADTNYNADSSPQRSFTVAKADQTLIFDISGANKKYGDAAFGLGAFTTPGLSTGAVSYTSLTTSVCTVAGALLTIHTAGDCTIKASQAGDGNYNAAPDVTSTLAVQKANQTLGFDISGLSKSYGDLPFDLTPSTTPGASTGAVSYTSLTLSVCTVANTNLTILTAGDCTIKASQAGDGNYNAAPDATSTLAVAKIGQTLVFDVSGLSKAFGDDPFDLTPSTTPGAGTGAVSYTSQTLSVCTVSGSSLTIIAAGQCTLNAHQASDVNYTAADAGPSSFTVAKGVNTITFTSTPPGTVNLNDTYTISATAASGGTVTFTIDPGSTSICHFSSYPTVTFDGRGRCDVNAAADATSNYLAGAGQQSIAVSDIPPVCQDGSTTVIMNVAKTGTLACTDAENDTPFTYSVDTQGLHGTVAFAGGTWTYTPEADYVGSDTFKVVGHDSLSAPSAPATITVDIVNRPAKARNDTATVVGVVPTSINVRANDLAGYLVSAPTTEQDPGQPLTITAVGTASLGKVTTDGLTLTYDPNGCSVGSDLVSYTVSDGVTTSQAYVAITVVRPGSSGKSKTPVTNAPTVSIATGSSMSSTVPFKVSWCGLTSTTKRYYYVYQSSNGGTTYASILSKTTATSTVRSIAVGHAYVFRARVNDGAGRYSAYATSIRTTVTRYQENSPSIVYVGSWANSKSTNFSSGYEKVASLNTASASLALPLGTRTFAIVASRATSRGSYRVYVDDVLVATISQKASKTAYRVIQYARSISAGSAHTIKVVPVGNGKITIDAILAMQ